MTVRKVVVIAENTKSKLKTIFKMTAADLDAPWETTTPLMHIICNDGVIQLSPLSSYAVLEVVEISRACFVHLVLQYSTNTLVNWIYLEATVEAEWILAFLFLQKWHFSMTSQLCHHYVVSCKYWWDILQFFNHTDRQDDLCQKNMKIYLNCQSYGQNAVGPFFPDTVFTRCLQWRT